MSVRLYMDVHVRRPVTTALRLRGVDMLTAQDDGATRLPDDELLNRAMELGRVLFSQDDASFARGDQATAAWKQICRRHLRAPAEHHRSPHD